MGYKVLTPRDHDLSPGFWTPWSSHALESDETSIFTIDVGWTFPLNPSSSSPDHLAWKLESEGKTRICLALQKIT
jgi:hypothetical protein